MSAPVIVNAIGVAAGLCSMASFVPQIVKIWRERDATGVSLRMFAVTVLGFGLWVIYGLFLGSWPLVASNFVSLTLAAIIMVLRIKFGEGAR